MTQELLELGGVGLDRLRERRTDAGARRVLIAQVLAGVEAEVALLDDLIAEAQQREALALSTLFARPAAESAPEASAGSALAVGSSDPAAEPAPLVEAR